MRLPILSALAGAALALTASLVLAHGGDETKIHACVKVNGGNVRIVGANDTCGSSEAALDWNQTTPTLSCPLDTTFFIGVCIENDSRAPDIQLDATDDCADEGRRLPSGGELSAFREVPGITLAAGGEWTDDVADVTLFSAFAIFVVGDTGNGVADGFDDFAYRCVAGPLLQ